jgi:hypothetical protein
MNNLNDKICEDIDLLRRNLNIDLRKQLDIYLYRSLYRGVMDEQIDGIFWQMSLMVMNKIKNIKKDEEFEF